MELIYKTLCEIKLEHEYFLTTEDGTSLFSESDPVKRLDSLQKAYSLDRETMNRDVYFDFPDKLKEKYEDNGLKLLPAYSGCRVLIRVNKKILPDNSLVFEPFFSIPGDFGIFILIVKKNNLPAIYSGERIERSIPSNFFFSNENLPDTKEFPFLVNPIAAFDSSASYEHGELAIDSTNKLQTYFYDSTGNLQPIEVKSIVRNFANENDRLLLPGIFNYTLTGNNAVTQLDISLKDRSGSVIKNFSFNQLVPIRQVQLNFSDKAGELHLTDTPSVPDGTFTLEALGNNGFSDKKRVVFGDMLYSIFNWGTIHLKTTVTNTNYNLISSDGYIIQRRDPSGVWTNAPVFEIPVKSRSCNFRYLNNNGKALTITNPALNDFLREENKALISLNPVPLCRYYFLVTDTGGLTKKYLPNPTTYDLKKDDLKRIYFDIMVPESDLFPVLP